MPYIADEHQYIDQATGVFRNKIGAKTQAKLDKAEAEITYIVITTLVQGSRVERLTFNTQLLKDVHKEIFRDIYAWAGNFRTVVMSKGDSTFANPEFIQSELDKLSKKLSHDARLNGRKDEFIDALVYYYAELNFIHPFREGNGRAIRTFLSLLAKKYDYVIAWNNMDPDENINACREAMHGRDRKMHDLLTRITSRI